MALKKRGKYRYGDSQTDIRAEVRRYSKTNAYLAHHFADAICQCGGRLFRLALDENEGAAVRTCVGCKTEHPIGDSDNFLKDAELEECACPCGGHEFEVTVGVSLYGDSEDVRWLYVGCRCPKCGLAAVYGDWKNEFNGYRELLGRSDWQFTERSLDTKRRCTMASLNIQFHVLPNELAQWIEEWRETFGLYVAVVYFWPRYRAKEVDDLREILTAHRRGESPNQVWLRCEPFVIVKNMTLFEERNSDALGINFPKVCENQLEESQICASSEDSPKTWPIWKRIGKDVKKRTRLGLWSFNPQMKIKGFCKDRRYSSGVAEAENTGIELVQHFGGNIFSIREPDQGQRINT
jgi:hypothetical protein